MRVFREKSMKIICQIYGKRVKMRNISPLVQFSGGTNQKQSNVESTECRNCRELVSHIHLESSNFLLVNILDLGDFHSPDFWTGTLPNHRLTHLFSLLDTVRSMDRLRSLPMLSTKPAFSSVNAAFPPLSFALERSHSAAKACQRKNNSHHPGEGMTAHWAFQKWVCNVKRNTHFG